MLLNILTNIVFAFNYSLVVNVPTDTFVPVGFDDNDNVQIVYEGYYNDSCYQYHPPAFEIDELNKKVYVTNKAKHFYENPCAKVISEYTEVLNLGIVAAGNYQVFYRGLDRNWIKASNLAVKEADNPAVDDHLYAPIADASTSFNKEKGAMELTLKIKTRHTCLKVSEVVTELNNNVINVLPIVKLDGDCDPSNEIIEMTEKVLLKGFSPGRYLLHIRSMNGRSVNKVVTL